MDICVYKKCKNKASLTYLNKPLCDKHWDILAEKTPKEIKEILGVKEKNEKE